MPTDIIKIYWYFSSPRSDHLWNPPSLRFSGHRRLFLQG